MSIKTFTGTATNLLNARLETGVVVAGLGSGTAMGVGIYNNTFFGYNNAPSVSAAFEISLFGARAGQSLTTGGGNCFFGSQAGVFTTSGDRNCFFGAAAGGANVLGGLNIYIGGSAGARTINAGDNIAIGQDSNGFNVSGNNNVFVGSQTYDTAFTSGNHNTILGGFIRSFGNISNTVIISDGQNTKNIIADLASFRTTAPIRPPQFTFAALPSPSTSGLGATCYCTNGRKSGEAAAAGTGCPVWSSGTAWMTYYGNTAITA